jgi:4-amino-4-deoxy-L-arabinose transferase-like glycosyltransferase
MTFLHHQAQALGKDTKLALQAVKKRLSRKDLWLDVLFLLLIAGLIRFFWLERPLEHDEAFTYYVFGRLPLRYAIADYSYPNNHIFHTLLLKLAVGLFGNASWVMRLPAYLFGTAIAPLVYAFARQCTHKRTASLLAGSLVALYPYMVQYSVNARGYSLAAAFTVMAAWLAWNVMQQKNRLLWLLFSLTIILGLYTLPIMLLPAGGLFTWLLLTGLLNKFTPAYGRWGWLKYMILSGLLIVLGTVILYLPVILGSGMGSLIANPNVAPLNPHEFLPTLMDRLKDIWKEWQSGFPIWLTLPASFFVLIGMLRFDKKSRSPVSLYLSLLLFLVLYSILQKPNLWPRVIYYLTPFLMLTLAFGLDALAAMLGRMLKPKCPLPAWLVPVSISLLTLLILLQTPNYSPLKNRLHGETEQIADNLAGTWEEGTLILIDYPEDMPLVVYMERVGLPASAVRWESPFTGAYVIVNDKENQTIESVIKNRGPELAFFDLPSARLVETLPHSSIYYVKSNWALVQQEYARESSK